MSTTESNGFVGVSIQTMRVSGCHAASSAAGSRRSHAVHAMPWRSCTRATRRNVPPYASFGMITWSPGSSVRRIASSAARPLANASPWRAPSSDATHVSMRGARGVAAARILVAAVLAHRLLREGRRQADRRHDRAGCRVGILARVDGAGLETVAMRGAGSCGRARREEAEHVGAGQHADRVAAVEHEHRRPRVEALDDARRRARRSRSSASADP